MLPMLITLIKGAITVAPAVEAAMRMRRSRAVNGAVRDIAAEREALLQVLQAHQFQTRQRNLIIAAVVIAVAVLAMTFTIALATELPLLAALNAAAGAVLVIFFNRLQGAYRARVQVTERAFRDLEDRLVAAGDPTRISLIAQAGGLSQDVLLVLFQAVAFWGFAAAFLYAVIQAA